MGCTYGGTTGYCPAAAIEVDNGAIAVLYKCVLVGELFSGVTRNSTIIMIECRLERSDDHRVTMVDCSATRA